MDRQLCTARCVGCAYKNVTYLYIQDYESNLDLYNKFHVLQCWHCERTGKNGLLTHKSSQ